MFRKYVKANPCALSILSGSTSPQSAKEPHPLSQRTQASENCDLLKPSILPTKELFLPHASVDLKVRKLDSIKSSSTQAVDAQGLRCFFSELKEKSEHLSEAQLDYLLDSAVDSYLKGSYRNLLINRLIDAFQDAELGNFPYKKESHEDIQNLWKENRENPEIIDLLGLLFQKLSLEMKKQGINHILWGFDTTLTEAFRHLSSIIETQNWQEKAPALKEFSMLMEAYQQGEDYLKKAVDQFFLEEGGAPFDTVRTL